MLVSVTERTREIGLRMAIGARRSDVLTQFALESVALSLLGGLIGLVIGVGGALVMSKFGDWPAAIPAWAAPLAIGFSTFVGVVFGAAADKPDVGYALTIGGISDELNAAMSANDKVVTGECYP